MLDTSFGSVLSILKDSQNMHQIAAKFVPYVLTEDQEKNHVSTCQDNSVRLERDQEFLLKIITGSEVWVDRYIAETKQYLFRERNPLSPHPTEARQDQSKCEEHAQCFSKHFWSCVL
jgi:hypothetical protein